MAKYKAPRTWISSSMYGVLKCPAIFDISSSGPIGPQPESGCLSILPEAMFQMLSGFFT